FSSHSEGSHHVPHERRISAGGPWMRSVSGRNSARRRGWRALPAESRAYLSGTNFVRSLHVPLADFAAREAGLSFPGPHKRIAGSFLLDRLDYLPVDQCAAYPHSCDRFLSMAGSAVSEAE